MWVRRRQHNRVLYATQKQQQSQSSAEVVCACVTNEKENKQSIGSSCSPSVQVSNAMRTAHILRQNTRGGQIQFGNFWLHEPFQINVYGRVAGMPGGYGSPPTNF
jgi:septum formation inhibitor MinC